MISDLLHELALAWSKGVVNSFALHDALCEAGFENAAKYHFAQLVLRDGIRETTNSRTLLPCTPGTSCFVVTALLERNMEELKRLEIESKYQLNIYV